MVIPGHSSLSLVVACRNVTIAALLAIVTLTGCSRKNSDSDIDYSINVNVTFDMQHVGDMNPAGICLYLYPVDDRLEVRRFDFKGATGGRIAIKPGRYNVMCYNNDTNGVDFRNTDNHETHEAYTRNGSISESFDVTDLPKAPGSEDEPIVICPDPMIGASLSDISLESDGTALTLQPRMLTDSYRYEITDVTGLSRISAVFASVSGMPPSMCIFSGNPPDRCATLVIEAVSDGASRITGEFVAFRHDPNCRASHRMMLYVITDDGALHCFGTSDNRFDITPQMHRHDASLLIKGLDIPQPDTPPQEDTGYSSDVDDWNTIDTDIDI